MRPDDHEHDHEPSAVWVAAGPAALAACIMSIGMFVTLLLLNLDALRPKVGDMVVFRPSTQVQDVWLLEVPVAEPAVAGRTTCAMDPAVIVRDGGSLVVEARDTASPAKEYRLHWAGAHSANGPGDCAGAQDLAVSRTDLQKLANAAGGFGFQHGMVR